jgi:antitoxin MazE
MRARIVAIGNSRGVRIPKTMLEHAGLGEDVELHAEPGRIVIESADRPRAGWEDAAAAMRAVGDDKLLDTPTATVFDDAEWEWR